MENLTHLTQLVHELEYLRFTLDRSAIVAVTDSAGRITYVNDKFIEISGYSTSELIGKTHRVINSGLHSAEFFRTMWDTIRAGQVWQGEICNRAKEGRLYWVWTTIVPYLSTSGEVEKYVAIRFEITQRKQAEEKLRQYATRLEQSNRELEGFASIAAHDLQEPLRKIQAFSDRVVQRESKNLSEQGQSYLKRVVDSAARMQTLINDLLTYSRVRSRGREFAATSLADVVRDVLSDLEVKVEATGAQLRVGDLPVVSADRTQMRQLFQNLISNSLKFARPGVTPRIEIQSEQVASGIRLKGLELRGSYVEIQVRDNGIGFDEKYSDRIFEIFQRLHGREEYEGTGLGLAVCKRIVERHGGHILAQSHVGTGSTFRVYLPVNQPEQF